MRAGCQPRVVWRIIAELSWRCARGPALTQSVKSLERRNGGHREGAKDSFFARNRAGQRSCSYLSRMFPEPEPNAVRCPRCESEDIEALGFEAAHDELFRQWKSTKALPVFKRIAYAAPERGGLALYMIQQQEDRLRASDWPKEWSALQNYLGEKSRGPGPPPFKDTSGLLIQFPVFGSRNRPPGGNAEEKSGLKSEAGIARPPGSREYRGRPGRPAEKEWAIFELDLDFLRTQWIPNLLREHIGQSNTGLLGNVEIKTRSSPEQIIYSSGQKASNGNGKRIIVSFNRLGSSIGAHEAERPPYWLLEATQNESQLGSLVAQARWRNLGVALVVNFLFLAAGVALIRYTRRSRSLAESQMRFVANVSHELRTPLTVILAQAII